MTRIDAILSRSRYGAGACLYSPAWAEAFLEVQNDDGPTARRELRAARAGVAIRFRVAVYNRHRDETVDECECYSWRGALGTVRALRDLFDCGRDGFYRHRYTIVVLDAKLLDAIAEAG